MIDRLLRLVKVDDGGVRVNRVRDYRVLRCPFCSRPIPMPLSAGAESYLLPSHDSEFPAFCRSTEIRITLGPVGERR